MKSPRRFGPYSVAVDNLDKVLYPEAGITKGQVVEYCESVAGVLLPHLRDRPLTLERFPDGIGPGGFYQKDALDHFPDWLHRVEAPLSGGGSQEQVTAKNTATLVYLAQLGTLTLHPWLSRTPELDRPDRMVFDLDPPEDDAGLVREVALRLREVLEEVGLNPHPMLTGSARAHLWVPLRRGPGFDRVRASARRVAEYLVQTHPGDFTMESRRTGRAGRLHLDVARNARGQTVVAPYSLRARLGAPVATPLTWQEFRRVRSSRRHTLSSMRDRLEDGSNPWKGMGRRARELDAAVEGADRVLGDPDPGRQDPRDCPGQGGPVPRTRGMHPGGTALARPTGRKRREPTCQETHREQLRERRDGDQVRRQPRAPHPRGRGAVEPPDLQRRTAHRPGPGHAPGGGPLGAFVLQRPTLALPGRPT